ncbi:hypothetical protein SDC9_185601 [bioreactor metagenome]|uniref:Uncharacterized protein n=1 Tax=bioreactor metagenome TaxID=1076179 RepID=A0A645HGB4_9ZZZZ
MPSFENDDFATPKAAISTASDSTYQYGCFFQIVRKGVFFTRNLAVKRHRDTDLDRAKGVVFSNSVLVDAR